MAIWRASGSTVAGDRGGKRPRVTSSGVARLARGSRATVSYVPNGKFGHMRTVTIDTLDIDLISH
jgi:hypothetical protein